MANPNVVINNVVTVTKKATETMCAAGSAAVGVVRATLTAQSKKAKATSLYREAAYQLTLMVDRVTLEAYIVMEQSKEKQTMLKSIPNLFRMREIYYEAVDEMAGSKTAKAAAYKIFNTDILKTYVTAYYVAEDSKTKKSEANKALKIAIKEKKSTKTINRLTTASQDASVLSNRDNLIASGKLGNATKQIKEEIAKVESKAEVKTASGFYADIQEAVKSHRELGKHAKRDTALFLAILPRLYEHKVCEKPVPVEHDVANPLNL